MTQKIGVSIKRTRAKMLSSIPERYMRLGSLMLLGTVASVLTLVAPNHARAMSLYSGTIDDQDLEVNLETTIQYSVFERVNAPSKVLAGPENANGNLGDLALSHGIVDNTIEVLPVFDLKYGSFGAHVSGEAYLDTPYLQNGQNGVHFSSSTRNINGQNALLLDAFVYGGVNFGANDDQSFTLKVGRQTLLWGQSLFFFNNGIAAGQAPVNLREAQSNPNAEAQQLFMPIGQVVATYQPNNTYTLQAYYQFEWQHYFYNGAGSYFSEFHQQAATGQQLFLGDAFPGGPPLYFYHVKDLRPPVNNGQFGASLQATFGIYDVGIYALRWDSKLPEVYSGSPNIQSTPRAPINAGSYWLVYPRDIQTYGASVSTNIGAANVAAEVSTRRNMPLAAAGLSRPPAYPGSANAGALYPVGNTLAAQVSAIYVSGALPLVPSGISFAGEVAMNHLISVTANRAALATGRQATAAAFQFVLTPQYDSVLPNLDVSFPIGLTYDFLGRSEIDTTMNHGTGNVTFGISGTYRTTWIGSLTYVNYLGKPDPTLNPIADRGYVGLNIQHTF